jgi:hypothetical protein
MKEAAAQGGVTLRPEPRAVFNKFWGKSPCTSP